MRLSQGLYPRVLRVVHMMRRVLTSLHSGNKPEVGITLFPVPEIDTGGERWVQNPR